MSEDEPKSPHIFEVHPTADDMLRLNAIGTPLEYCFYGDGRAPHTFPTLKPGQHLVFYYLYDNPETGKEIRTADIVDDYETMVTFFNTVKFNVIGIDELGWQIVEEPTLTD